MVKEKKEADSIGIKKTRKKERKKDRKRVKREFRIKRTNHVDKPFEGRKRVISNSL
jgi:hypothetical protein